MINQLPIDELRQLLKYDPKTGNLTWHQRPRELFKSERSCSIWNVRFANKPAFTSLCRGYNRGLILGVNYHAHRVAWAIHYGWWPKDQLDHINGDRTDNRIDNLREVDGAENHKNQKLSKNNTSGHSGVYWNKPSRKWVAQIQAEGSRIHLGVFGLLEDAIEARIAAELRYGYHPNHGRR
jgi:hypothetical protein